VAAFVLVQLLNRARPYMLPPVTVSLVAEPAPAAEEPETPPQPLPQAPEPLPRPPRAAPKAAEPPAPLPVPDPPSVQVEPEVQPEPPEPVRAVESPPEPAPPAPPPPPVARIEPEAVRVPPPPEPVRPPAPPTVAAAPPPVTAAPAPPRETVPAPVTEPLYGADYLRNPKPVYPLMSRRMGEQGVVLLRVFVTADGDPREVVLKEGSGYSRLDRAAQEVVQRWKFVPAKRGSQPVDAWVLVPIRFSLKG
jgi:protein TonB